MDELLSFLFDEMAIEGERGLTLAALQTAIEAHDAERAKRTNSPPQYLDYAYRNFVWRSMRHRPEVRVGRLLPAAEIQAQRDATAASSAAKGKKSTARRSFSPNPGQPGGDAAMDVDESHAEQEEDEHAEGVKGKGKDKATKSDKKGKEKKGGVTGSHTVDGIAHDEEAKKLDLDALHKQYGDALRFGLDDATLRFKLTGSHNPAFLTQVQYAALQLVMRTRGQAISSVDVGTALAVNNRDMYYVNDKLIEKGLIVKFRGQFGKSAPNHLVATRFKEQCEAYMQLQRLERLKEGTRQGANDADEDEEAGDAASGEAQTGTGGVSAAAAKSKPLLMDAAQFEAEEEGDEDEDASQVIPAADSTIPISSDDFMRGMLAYPPCSRDEVEGLVRDAMLIRARLIKLLQMSNNHIIMRRSIGRRLGLPTNESVPIMKSITRIIKSMALAEHIRLVRVVVPSPSNDERTERCLQLLDGGVEWAAEYAQTTFEKSQAATKRHLETQLKRYETPCITREVPVERQITEMICNSGSKGITIAEIAERLGATFMARRSIIQCIEKLATANILAFDDAGISELRDNEGRMRHLRYYSRLSFQRLYKDVELPGYESTTEQANFRDPKALYDYPELPYERTWTDRADMLEKLSEHLSKKRKASADTSTSLSSKKARIAAIDPLTGTPLKGRPRKYPGTSQEAKQASAKAARERKKFANMTPEEVQAYKAKEADAQAKSKARQDAKEAKAAAKTAKNATPKGPIGRPRKNWEELTPSARRYREKVDKAAAVAAAAAAAAGGDAGDDDEDEEERQEEQDKVESDAASEPRAGPGPGTAASPSLASTPGVSAPRRGRPRKPVDELTTTARKRRERLDRIAADKAAEAAAQAGASSSRTATPNYRASVSRDSADDVLDVLGLGEQHDDGERSVASDEDELASPVPKIAVAPAPSAKNTARTRASTADSDNERPSKRSKRSSAKAAQATATAADDNDNESEEEVEASQRGRNKTPASPEDVSSDVDMEVVQRPATRDTADAPRAPAATAPSTPAPVGTSAASSRKKAAKPPESKPRVSIATSQRVALLRAMFEEEDTKIVDQAHLATLYRRFVERTKGTKMAESEVGNLFDLKVRTTVIDQLIQRDILMKTTCTAPYLNSKLAPRQCVVLSHTSVPVEEVDEFVTMLSQGKTPRTLAGSKPDVPNLGMTAMEDISLSGHYRRKGGGNPFFDVAAEELLTDSKHHDLIFNDALTRSQLQGYLPGDVARLECFHLSVLQLFDAPEQDEDDDGAEIVSSKAVVSPEEGIFETESLVVDALPVRDLLRVVTSTPSESLRSLLADMETSAKPIAEQPPLVSAELNTPSTHETIAEYLNLLEQLRLIEPMTNAGNGKWKRGSATKKGETAEYYRVVRKMKLLGWDESFNYKEVDTPFNLMEPAEHSNYWRELSRTFPPLDLDKCDNEEVKSLCITFRRTSANSKHYNVSKTQKHFLERFVDEATTKDLMDNEERMMRISSAVVAPLWVTLRWFEAKCNKKLPSDHALKIKARAVRKQQFGLSSESDPTGINPIWSAEEIARQARTAVRLRRQKWTETLKRVLADCNITDQQKRDIKSVMFPLKKMYANDPSSIALADLEKMIKNAVENISADQRGEPIKKDKMASKTAGQLKFEAAKAEKARIQAELGNRQRTPRSTFKWDRQSDEKLRDAVVILRARDKARGNKRQNWAALAQIFPSGNPARERFKKLCNAIGEKAYLDQLEVEWTKLWVRYRGTEALPDPDPSSATNFDLSEHIEFLQAHVDKEHVLDIVERGDMEPLPSDPVDIAELMETYDCESPPIGLEHMWDTILEDSNTSMTQRTNHLHNHAFTFSAVGSAEETVELAAGLAQAFVKMSVQTSDERWSSPIAEAIMATLGGEGIVSTACQTLQDAKVIRLKQSDRRMPGNNFIYADGAFPTPFHELDPPTLAKARASAEKKGIKAAPDLDDVHTAMIITMLSECRLEPEFDLACVDQLKNADMFNAKRLLDSEVELEINFTPCVSKRAPFTSASTMPNPAPVLDWLNNRHDADDQQLEARVDEAWDAAIKACDVRESVCVQKRVRELLAKAGKEGVLKDELKQELSATVDGVSEDTIFKALEELSYSTPPLVFWAGYDAPRIISASFVEHWALHVASREVSSNVEPMDVDDETAQLDKYVFPRLWLDIYGNFSSEAWERGIHAVLRTVYLRPGTTFTHLVRLLGPAHDRLELVDLVNAACEAKMLQKQALPKSTLARSHKPEWVASGDDVVLLPPGVDWSPLALTL